MTELWLARADERRADRPAVDRRIRAALVTAMAVGIPLLHEHVSRALGADMFEPEGDRMMALALLDIYAHPLIDDATAASVRSGFGRRKRRAVATRAQVPDTVVRRGRRASQWSPAWASEAEGSHWAQRFRPARLAM